MKYNNICPKCKNNEIAKLESGGMKGNSTNNYIVGFNIIYFTKYVCVCCGYAEDYVNKSEDLELLRKKFIDTGIGSDFV
jgi:predicted nucleic-acid-binding Zn-ribbon protein